MLDGPGRPIEDGDGNWYSSRNAMYVLLIYKVMTTHNMDAKDVQEGDIYKYIDKAPWFVKRRIHGQFGRVKWFCKNWGRGKFRWYIEQEMRKQEQHRSENAQLPLLPPAEPVRSKQLRVAANPPKAKTKRAPLPP